METSITFSYYGSVANQIKNQAELAKVLNSMKTSTGNTVIEIPSTATDFIIMEVNQEFNMVLAFTSDLEDCVIVISPDNGNGQGFASELEKRTEMNEVLMVTKMKENEDFEEEVVKSSHSHTVIYSTEDTTSIMPASREEMPVTLIDAPMIFNPLTDVFVKESQNGNVYEMLFRDGIIYLDKTCSLIIKDLKLATIVLYTVNFFEKKSLNGVPVNLVPFF